MKYVAMYYTINSKKYPHSPIQISLKHKKMCIEYADMDHMRFLYDANNLINLYKKLSHITLDTEIVIYKTKTIKKNIMDDDFQIVEILKPDTNITNKIKNLQIKALVGDKRIPIDILTLVKKYL